MGRDSCCGLGKRSLSKRIDTPISQCVGCRNDVKVVSALKVGLISYKRGETSAIERGGIVHTPHEKSTAGNGCLCCFQKNPINTTQ